MAHNYLGAAIMATLAVGTYILLHIIAKSMDKKARKERQERINGGFFDIDP